MNKLSSPLTIDAQLSLSFLPGLFSIRSKVRMYSWHSFGTHTRFARTLTNFRPQDSVVFVARAKQEIKEGLNEATK